VGANGLIDWPPARATPLANLEEEAGQRAVSLAAEFDLSFMRAETYLRANKGVLVIVLFVTFHDDSGRSNYLNREFFYRRD
jgi:protein subunit release factor B